MRVQRQTCRATPILMFCSFLIQANKMASNTSSFSTSLSLPIRQRMPATGRVSRHERRAVSQHPPDCREHFEHLIVAPSIRGNRNGSPWMSRWKGVGEDRRGTRLGTWTRQVDELQMIAVWATLETDKKRKEKFGVPRNNFMPLLHAVWWTGSPSVSTLYAVPRSAKKTSRPRAECALGSI